MKANARYPSILAAAAIVALPVALTALVLSIPTVPVAVPGCAPLPFPLNPVEVPAGQDTVVSSVGLNSSNPYGGPIPQWRLSIWSSSTTVYDMFLLTSGQYNAFVDANGTGFNGSVLQGSPNVYVWSSGLTTWTNHTSLLGNGTWYLLVYNPGSTGITVDVESESCNAP